MKTFKEYVDEKESSAIMENIFGGGSEFKSSHSIHMDELKRKAKEAIDDANSHDGSMKYAKRAEKASKALSSARFSEGFGGAMKVIGIGAMGIASAWLVSLICKGLAKAGGSMMNNFRNAGFTKDKFSSFKRNVDKERKTDAVKDQSTNMSDRRRKLDGILGPVYVAIDNDDMDEAHKEYMALTNAQRAMPEVNQSIIEECTKKYGLPTYGHTPGSICYQKIKAITDIRIAKAASVAVEEKMKELAMAGDEGEEGGE